MRIWIVILIVFASIAVTAIADNLNAVREAQRIFKESETEKVVARE